jgi:hypothetical protein
MTAGSSEMGPATVGEHHHSEAGLNVRPWGTSTFYERFVEESDGGNFPCDVF